MLWHTNTKLQREKKGNKLNSDVQFQNISVGIQREHEQHGIQR